MNKPDVKELFGHTIQLKASSAKSLYHALQDYIQGRYKDLDWMVSIKAIEYWPLIKVVRIYTKADALSTGAVVVDLPAADDYSNAARSVLASTYISQCTGKYCTVHRPIISYITNNRQRFGLSLLSPELLGISSHFPVLFIFVNYS